MPTKIGIEFTIFNTIGCEYNLRSVSSGLTVNTTFLKIIYFVKQLTNEKQFSKLKCLKTNL